MPVHKFGKAEALPISDSSAACSEAASILYSLKSQSLLASFSSHTFPIPCIEIDLEGEGYKKEERQQ